MNTQIVQEYRKLRKPAWYKTSCHQLRASTALEMARYKINVQTAWDTANNVRLRIEPDYDADLDDLLGETYDHKANPDINPAKLDRERQEEIDRINRLGVYGIIGEYRCPRCHQWKVADSVWGFVGDDWKESGYDLDVMHETLVTAGLL